MLSGKLVDNKERYRQICEAEGACIPLFQQYWWWETVCRGKRWDVLLCERDGVVRGAMPYLDGRRMCLRHSLMPQLTMFTGPWLADKTDKEAFDDLWRQFASRRWALCKGRLSPELTAAALVPPEGLGLKAEMHYTYRFDPIRPLAELMPQATQLRRRDYRRLCGELVVDEAVSPQEFADLHADYMKRRDRRDLLEHSFIVHVCGEAVARGNGMLIGARDADGRLHDALFVAYDSECAYMLMLARGSEAPRNSMSFLIWKAIEIMGAHTKVFDFEGSMEPGVEEYYRSFGSQKACMLQVSRCRIPFIRI